jgi:apolipoprotein N-acyltransferase
MATVTRFASIGVLIAATLPWFPTPLSLSSPLSQVTPLTVGCVLSPNHQNTPDALIHETLRIANHASVVVWSESAIRVDSEAGRESVLNTVADQVVKNRGTLVAVGIESPTDEGKMKNELVMIGCDGVVGEYTKQHLFPGKSVAHSADADASFRVGLFRS